MYDLDRYKTMLSSFLSPWYGVSSGCRWRRQPPDMVGSYNYTEQAVRQLRGWSSNLGVGHGVNSSAEK
jgi:hypothetical protein